MIGLTGPYPPLVVLLLVGGSTPGEQVDKQRVLAQSSNILD